MAARRTTAVLATAGAGACLIVSGALALSDTPPEQVLASSSAHGAPAASAAPQAAAAIEAPRLIVDDPRCSGTVAYDMADATVDPRAQRPSAYFVNGERDLAGPVAALTVLNDEGDLAQLAAPSVTRQLVTFPDGTAVIEWREGERPVGLLSAKRVPLEDLERLGDAIARGEESADGVFQRVDAPAAAASVRGSSCTVDGEFVGVEVVSGDFAAQVDYAFNTDPNGVLANADFVVLSFNRLDPTAPVPTREVNAETWATLVAQSEARTDAP